MGGVAFPVGRFEVEVAAEKGVEGWASGVGHVGVGGVGAVVPFVVFAGTGKGGEGGLDVGLLGKWRLRGVGGWGGRGGEGEWGGAFGGVGHENEGLEDVGTGEGAEGGCDGAEVVADDAGDGGVAEGGDEGESVFDEVEWAEGACGEGCWGVSAAIASLVEGYGVVALGGQKREDLAPGVGEFGETVDEENEFGGSGSSARQGFEDMEDQAVRSGINVAGCYTRR